MPAASATSTARGFNGAADRDRRRPVEPRRQPGHVGLASMEPPIVIGGDAFGLNTAPHALQAASMEPPIVIGGDGPRAPAVQGTAGAASMEPPIVIGGDPRERRASRPEPRSAASMEPPIVIGGDERGGGAGAAAHVASMEPPIVIGGDATRSTAIGGLSRGFNGAADRDRRRPASCGREPTAGARFNGAADRDRRRQRRPAHAHANQRELQWSRRS